MSLHLCGYIILSDKSCASVDPLHHTHPVSLSPQLCLVSLSWQTGRTQAQFLAASLNPFSVQRLHVTKTLTSSLLLFENLCPFIKNKFFVFCFYACLEICEQQTYGPSCSSTVTTLQPLQKNKNKCGTQKQRELASCVKELTHCRRSPWYFSVLPHASYRGVKWVEQMSGFYNLYLVRKRWFISNNMLLCIHAGELLSLNSTHGANECLWIDREHYKSIVWFIFHIQIFFTPSGFEPRSYRLTFLKAPVYIYIQANPTLLLCSSSGHLPALPSTEKTLAHWCCEGWIYE